MTAREHAVQVLCRAGLYRPARNAYQRLLERDEWRARERQRNMLREFVPRGSLTFDIGANNGRFSEALLELGSRPVAVEPNPQLVEAIRRRYPSVRVEPYAVGARAGEAELHLGVWDGHSTLSDRWMQNAPRAGMWEGSVTVPVVTLDELIARHGRPAFIKIDVEGFEAEVLGGLSQPVRALSIEYHSAIADAAQECLARLQDLGLTRFRLANAELNGWATGDVSAAEVLRRVRAGADDAYGDIFASS